MSFNVSTKTIKFNYLQINGYIANINFKIKENDEDCVKLILFHQLGYYLDFKKNRHDLRTLKYGEDEEKEQLLALIERNSWEYGRTLVPERLLKSYDQVRSIDQMLLKKYWNEKIPAFGVVSRNFCILLNGLKSFLSIAQERRNIQRICW